MVQFFIFPLWFLSCIVNLPKAFERFSYGDMDAGYLRLGLILIPTILVIIAGKETKVRTKLVVSPILLVGFNLMLLIVLTQGNHWRYLDMESAWFPIAYNVIVFFSTLIMNLILHGDEKKKIIPVYGVLFFLIAAYGIFAFWYSSAAYARYKIEDKMEDRNYKAVEEVLSVKSFFLDSAYIEKTRSAIREERAKIDNLVEKAALLQKDAMVFVEGGSFKLNENTIQVDGFYISKYEVTLELYELLRFQSLPEYVKTESLDNPGKSLPADSIDWYEAVEFCNLLSIYQGLEPCYTIDKERKDPDNMGSESDDSLRYSVTCDFSKNGYRLPTHAEWIFAAIGGNKSKGYKYSGSNFADDVAWYPFTFKKIFPREIGLKKANELGLFDMSGNMAEWCWDWGAGEHNDYQQISGKNPKGPRQGDTRVIKGAYNIRLSDATGKCLNPYYEDSRWPDGSWADTGFRLVRSK